MILRNFGIQREFLHSLVFHTLVTNRIVHVRLLWYGWLFSLLFLPHGEYTYYAYVYRFFPFFPHHIHLHDVFSYVLFLPYQSSIFHLDHWALSSQFDVQVVSFWLKWRFSLWFYWFIRTILSGNRLWTTFWIFFLMIMKFHCRFNYRVFFEISYPTHNQFDNIANAIVKFLKLSITVENIVSSFIIYNEHYLLSNRPSGKMLFKRNWNENVQNTQITLLFKNIGWDIPNLDQDDRWNDKLEQQHNVIDINK